jgi:hypothetical protein
MESADNNFSPRKWEYAVYDRPIGVGHRDSDIIDDSTLRSMTPRSSMCILCLSGYGLVVNSAPTRKPSLGPHNIT